jgi:transcriptional regulator with XRE-family HTH domain
LPFTKICGMSIHIGQLIKEKVTEKRLSQEALGKMINTTKQNVGNIYKRRSIDTQLLLKLCAVLEYDFFEAFYTEEPLKSMRKKELDAFNTEINNLQNTIRQKDERIRDLEEIMNSNKKVISLLEEEKAQYKKKD